MSSFRPLQGNFHIKLLRQKQGMIGLLRLPQAGILGIVLPVQADIEIGSFCQLCKAQNQPYSHSRHE